VQADVKEITRHNHGITRFMCISPHFTSDLSMVQVDSSHRRDVETFGDRRPIVRCPFQSGDRVPRQVLTPSTALPGIKRFEVLR
jgi:hypothetical protein